MRGIVTRTPTTSQGRPTGNEPGTPFLLSVTCSCHKVDHECPESQSTPAVEARGVCSTANRPHQTGSSRKAIRAAQRVAGIVAEGRARAATHPLFAAPPLWSTTFAWLANRRAHAPVSSVSEGWGAGYGGRTLLTRSSKLVMARDLWQQGSRSQSVSGSPWFTNSRSNPLDSTPVVQTFWTRQ